MKKMTKDVLSVLSLVACLFSFSASAEDDLGWSASGSYAVGKTTSISINDFDGVYLKLSGFKAGSDYTFIVNGSGASVEVVYTYSEEGELWDTTFGETMPDVKTENQERCIVKYDDWINEWIIKDPEYEYESGEWDEFKVSPKGYFVHVTGDEGATVTLTSMNGAVEEPIPVGDPENPKSLAPTTLPQMYKASYTGGGYYFVVSAKAERKYLFATVGGTVDTPISLIVDSDSAYTVEDVTSTIAKTGNKAYLVTTKKAGEISFHVAGGGTTFGLQYQYATDGVLGQLTVNTKGTEGKWSIKGASGTYESGETIVILGQQTVVFSKVSGFSTPPNQTALPTERNPEVELLGVYNDTYDPKDDVASKATALTLGSTAKYAGRTLFAEDPLDHFSFAAKDGYYYNFALENLEGKAEMVIFEKGDDDEEILVGPSTNIVKQTFAKGNYILRVRHGKPAGDAQYELAYQAVNAGVISFAKTAVSVDKTKGSVAITVNRSSSEGKVRVRYGTVNTGDALPGVDYVAQNGVLTWEDGDKKAKTITIKLIPELFAEEVVSRTFLVKLEPMDEDDLGDDEYLASIADGKDAVTVTVTEKKAKEPTAVKPATVKTTEDAPLESGTYQGVVVEDGSALTNGFPALASVTFTSKKGAATKALSAKVILAGKSYPFSADTWTAIGDGYAHAELVCKQKVNKEEYENFLDVIVRTGDASEDWKLSVAEVELTMNVPDVDAKGVQADVVYSGKLYRDNSKVQDYLYAVTNAVGYYTIALAPSGVLPGDGIPAGNGYLTVTIDNKGKAKVAGMLADGTTKPSYTSIVAMDAGDDAFLVPVFVAKSPYCFGGELRFVRGADGQFVVDSTIPLLWNNDNAALTYDGEEGWSIDVDPVGGYFNTVNNLQAYYKTCTFAVSTVESDNWLEEALTDGYDYVTDIQPNGYPVSLVGNTLSTDKKSLYKPKGSKVYDLQESVNPCNVQVKLTRATGLVTGSFSLWSEADAGEKQKELTGLKHYGILLLSRDEAAPLDTDVMTAGFFTQTGKISYEVQSGKKTVTKTRSYTASNPFNILAVDQGEPDWYADDWGERDDD